MRATVPASSGVRGSDPTPRRGSGSMSTIVDSSTKPVAVSGRANRGTAFGCARDFGGNRFVYTVVSPRARGLSVGVNLTPDKQCNFDCPYCEVDRSAIGQTPELDLDVLSAELQVTLALVHSGNVRHKPAFALVPSDL